MSHRILTCRNHRHLRWSCKGIAWTNGYNHSRNLFFKGEPDGQGMFHDHSGLSCSMLFMDRADPLVHECACPASDLVLAPEDKLVGRAMAYVLVSQDAKGADR